MPPEGSLIEVDGSQPIDQGWNSEIMTKIDDGIGMIRDKSHRSKP
jgi:hypothetical protein